MARIFVYDGTEYPDPDPKLTVDEVRRFMATLLPELSNAEAKESKQGEDTIIELKKRVGTKGTGPGISSDVDTSPIVPKEGTPCRLGFCVTRRCGYSGMPGATGPGNEAAIEKLKNGICPICGGPTDRKYWRD